MRQTKVGEQDQDVWFSRKDGAGKYNDCERLTDVNNKFNNAVLGLNTTGNFYVPFEFL